MSIIRTRSSSRRDLEATLTPPIRRRSTSEPREQTTTDAIKAEWMASSQIEDRKGLLLSRFFSTMENKQNLLRTDVDKIRTDVDKIRTDVDKIRTDVEKIRTDVNELSTDVKQLPQTIRSIVREEIQNAIQNETRKQIKNLLKLGFDNL